MNIPAFEDPEFLKGVQNAGSEFYFRSLQELVRRLEATLSGGEHVEIVHHQTGKPIAVRTVEYPGSQEIILIGTTADGSEVRVLAHVAGLQLEIKVVRDDSSASSTLKHREIGFKSWHESGANAEEC